MPQSKYERLPRAGDYEREAGTEVFYLSPKPVPTGMAAVSEQQLHQETSEVYLDMGTGQASVEFAARAYIGSVMSLIIAFTLIGIGLGIDDYFQRGDPVFDVLLELVIPNYYMWIFIGFIASLGIYNMVRIIRAISYQSPIRFNRQRREVAVVQRNHPPVYVPWEEVIACVSATQIVTQYAVMPSFALQMGLRDAHSGDVHWATIPTAALSLAVGEWEGIRLYMEEGPQALPPPTLIDEEFQEGTVAYFHMCRKVYRKEHWWIRYFFGFLVIQFCSGWTLPCYISAWVNNRPKALFPKAVLDWSQPIPPEQHAKPSAELLQESAEVRQALKKGQTLLDYYKVKFNEEETPSRVD